jgi:hypothetical protein
MNARVQHEKTYGGLTLSEIKVFLNHADELDPGNQGAQVTRDLILELEQSSGPEVVQRLRRMETKLHKIGLKTGAESETTVTLLAREAQGLRTVDVPGYDVTLAQIRRATEAQQWASGSKLYIMRGDDLLATLVLTDQQ